MFLYNVHTPHKTFALQHKGECQAGRVAATYAHLLDDESFAAFLDRIAPKAGLQTKDVQALKEGKDGSGLVYEYEGERYSLEDGPCCRLDRLLASADGRR